MIIIPPINCEINRLQPDAVHVAIDTEIYNYILAHAWINIACIVTSPVFMKSSGSSIVAFNTQPFNANTVDSYCCMAKYNQQTS